MQYPDSPEAVALVLLCMILATETADRQNISREQRVLNLFSECLLAARGERDVSHGRHH